MSRQLKFSEYHTNVASSCRYIVFCTKVWTDWQINLQTPQSSHHRQGKTAVLHPLYTITRALKWIHCLTSDIWTFWGHCQCCCFHLSYIFHCQGADALFLRTAAASSVKTQKDMWTHVHGDSFNFSLAEEIQNSIFICLCSGYNVSLCSLIHVFVWNMSRLIKQTIKHNQSTLLRKQGTYW